MASAEGPAQEQCGFSFEHLSRLPDTELMMLLRSGHNDALAVFFDRYHRLILNVAHKILRDLEEAEDVMQSVFLEIYKVASQFDASRGSVKVWLLQYAYHRSMNRRAYLKLRGFYDREPAVGRAPVAEKFSSRAAKGTLSDSEVRYLARESLETLNHSQRSVLQMAYFEDLPFKEIARRTGDSLASVRHHYYRALRRLRTLLQGDGNRGERTREELRGQGATDAEVEAI